MVLLHSLQEDYRVIALDQRGHGETDWPDPPSCATQNFADGMPALTESLRLWPFIIVGLSNGGAQRSGVRNSASRTRVENVWRDFASIDDMVEDARDAYPFASEQMIRHRMEHNAYQLSSGRYALKHSPDAGTPMISPSI